MLSVVIPAYKSPDHLKICIDSLLMGLRHQQRVQVILVFDGHSDLYDGVIPHSDCIEIIDLPVNKGMAYAINVGVSAALYKNVLIINEDNVFPMQWDVPLIHDLCIGNTSNDTCFTINQIEPGKSIYDFINYDLGKTPKEFNYHEFIKYEQSKRAPNGPNLYKIHDYGGGVFPFLVNKKHFMMVGGFDTLYPNAYIVDWDFFLKLELAGVQLHKYNGIALYHFVGSSESEIEIKRREQEVLSAKTYLYKWGHMPIRNKITNSHIPKNTLLKGIQY